MKKVLTILICAITCVTILSSCSNYSKNEFFSNERLSQNKLTDIPVPPNLSDSVISHNGSWGDVLYLNLTNAEYEQYIIDLLTYLKAKEDIYYLGYSIGSGLLGEMFPYDEIAPITDSYDAKGDDHHFFFSTVDGLGNSNSLDTPVEIRIIRDSGKLKFDNYEYNTKIIICDGMLAHSTWNQCGAEHTYDEGIEYQIAGSDSTVTEYTCVYCGCTEVSDFIGDMKTYQIIISDTEADHYIVDRRDSCISGVICCIRTQKPVDAELKFTVNGTEIEPREKGYGYLWYEFIMPCSDVVVTTELTKMNVE